MLLEQAPYRKKLLAITVSPENLDSHAPDYLAAIVVKALSAMAVRRPDLISPEKPGLCA